MSSLVIAISIVLCTIVLSLSYVFGKWVAQSTKFVTKMKLLGKSKIIKLIPIPWQYTNFDKYLEPQYTFELNIDKYKDFYTLMEDVGDKLNDPNATVQNDEGQNDPNNSLKNKNYHAYIQPVFGLYTEKQSNHKRDPITDLTELYNKHNTVVIPYYVPEKESNEPIKKRKVVSYYYGTGDTDRSYDKSRTKQYYGKLDENAIIKEENKGWRGIKHINKIVTDDSISSNYFEFMNGYITPYDQRKPEEPTIETEEESENLWQSPKLKKMLGINKKNLISKKKKLEPDY